MKTVLMFLALFLGACTNVKVDEVADSITKKDLKASFLYSADGKITITVVNVTDKNISIFDNLNQIEGNGPANIAIRFCKDSENCSNWKYLFTNNSDIRVSPVPLKCLSPGAAVTARYPVLSLATRPEGVDYMQVKMYIYRDENLTDRNLFISQIIKI
ncbi:hypothetical protein [Saccharophagus degradans]|uniref:Lipoprotein n=1 Tax=Saccharophagus degradans TaxID=86304 RepID=A0AAW7XA34_9GAMM|nr:hypothetical protein [Saccharophagus degradans]MDO6424740.1 hypothetical protein [Saccharophagus degradans]MDO6609508.1 hypothetical protein [Saccharophagus degradans]